MIPGVTDLSLGLRNWGFRSQCQCYQSLAKRGILNFSSGLKMPDFHLVASSIVTEPLYGMLFQSIYLLEDDLTQQYCVIET